ncbi:hypothetical protein ASC95_25060 [Pelomonas sp. Root1217]|uniref:hypothetical protein n=1 Tax=Pelomonas sp. Root1217 TaxID=1736430 RepID=UPI00070CF7D3|nr:hypothetical protein [Pelomonas sp. Root1217]KQV46802.1 hypothetical protein ASC95_25060 [Pelomonas sp. Root1217]
MRRPPLGACWALALPALLAPAVASAGPQAGQAAVVVGDACPANGAFGGMPIHAVDVQTPLAFLPWIRADLNQAKALAEPLRGTPYSASQVTAVWNQIAALPFANLDVEARVGGRVLPVMVSCTPQGLDLVFFVYAIKASLSVGLTWESRQRETAAPERQSGQEALRPGMRLQPRLGYRGGEGAGAGLAALYNRSGAGADADTLYWRSVAVDAYASDRLRDMALALEGGREHSDGIWAHTAWRLGYADQSVPAKSVSRLGQSNLEAQAFAQTHPLGSWALALRLGAALDAGQHRSRGQDDPAAGLVADQRYQSLKLMAGTTARLARQSLAASYAVEFGAGSGGAGLDWVKQIIDIAHEGRWPVADHRSLSLETRLTLGHLREQGLVPHGARFFAGGREQQFIGGEEWQIRAAPLLRSLGTNALAGSPASPGYQRFAALSLTAALPVFNQPLVPAEAYRDAQVRTALNGQLDSAVGGLAADNRTTLPTYLQAIAQLPTVQRTLAALDAALAAVAPAAGSADSDLFAACKAQLGQAQDEITQVLLESSLTQLGLFTELLPGEDTANTVGQVVALCVESFNAGPRHPQVTQQGAALRAAVKELVRLFVAADPKLAEQDARREIEPVRHIVDTLMDEINAVAISPLLMLDAVNPSPRLSGPRTRLAVGTGLRVTLVDSVDFSLGYMANLRRQAGEARGAFFVTMQFKDPF